MLRDKDGHVMIQVKVPVCITLNIKREDAESMHHHELREVCDCILQDVAEELGIQSSFCAQTEAFRSVPCEYDLVAYWDQVPEDECELYMTEDGLFPLDEDEPNDEEK